jgi:hypothetical protein
MHDILAKIGISLRAYGCTQREQEDGKRDDCDFMNKLILNPSIEDIDIAQEFRLLFCLPLHVDGPMLESIPYRNASGFFVSRLRMDCIHSVR